MINKQYDNEFKLEGIVRGMGILDPHKLFCGATLIFVAILRLLLAFKPFASHQQSAKEGRTL